MAGTESGVLETLAQAFSLATLPDGCRRAFARLPLSVAQELVRVVYREVKATPLAHSLLFLVYDRCSATESSLERFVGEILAVYRWLSTHHRTAKILDVLEYVSCAQEGSDTSCGHSIEWYLEQFGFLRSYPIAA